ncbi:hypothetical protein [Nocardia xishanensis]|uniref:Uncharacterized protein n=1 Tax=Nocardia xishanensis TaxID=238964 RepID=A0ABW7X799_9NOCA
MGQLPIGQWMRLANTGTPSTSTAVEPPPTSAPTARPDEFGELDVTAGSQRDRESSVAVSSECCHHQGGPPTGWPTLVMNNALTKDEPGSMLEQQL